MAAFMPGWRPLDATHSGRLLSERPRGGRVVALCVSPGLAGRPEGARLAVSLARRWTEGGLSVVLADGDVAHPILHLAVGVPNAKGLADILLVGDAWEPLALPTPAPGLRLIPAGGRAAPTGSEAARDRLADLCREVPDGGATFVLYVPLGSMAAEWAIEACTDIVVLSGEKEPVASFFADDEDRIRAHVGPPPPQRQRATGPEAPLEATQRPAAPPRATEPDAAQGRASLEPEARAAPSAADRAAREPVAEDRTARSASRLEDKWAEAAAMLRARGEGRPPGNGDKPGPTSEPAPAPRPKEPPARAERPPEPGWPAQAPPKAVASEPPAPRIVEAARAAPEPGQQIRPPRRFPRVDPLTLPPVVEAELEHVGSEEEDAALRWAHRRRIAARTVAAFGGVAVVAGAVWIWNATRSMPPYEAWSTPLPRASLPPAETPAVATEDTGAGAAPPEASAGPADSGQTPDTASAPATPAGRMAEAPPEAAPVAVTHAPHQRYSWSIAAMGTLDAARSLAERLRRAAPDRAFMVAPVVSGDRTLYRVLGGLALDREELVGTRESLSRETGLAPGGWLVREAPLAFALRDFGNAQEAATWAGELWGEGIPVYVLVVERDDGSVVHRVYSGAYASEEEAAPLRAVLESAGVCPETLSERRGRSGS